MHSHTRDRDVRDYTERAKFSVKDGADGKHS